MKNHKESKIKYVKPEAMDIGAFGTLVGAAGCSAGTSPSVNCTPTGNQVTNCADGNSPIFSTCSSGNDASSCAGGSAITGR